MSPLFIIGNDDISVLEENLNQSREELEEARTQAGANRQAAATMAWHIAMLIEDQSLRRQELDSLRRQLDVSIASALNAQSRLQAYVDLPSRSLMQLLVPH